MPRLAAAALALAIGAAASLALASCGGSDARLLPGNTAQEINENLDSVQRLVDEGECIDAQDAALEVSTEVESLQGIDPKLKEALQGGAARLNEVVAGCQESEETAEETLPETTESTEEKPEKKEKKPKKVEPEETQPEEEEEPTKPPVEPPEPPGKAKGHEETPPVEEESPSGGIGPGAATEEGD